MVKKILTVAAMCGAIMVAACNTVAGAGEDVQSVGETVEDAAE